MRNKKADAEALFLYEFRYGCDIKWIDDKNNYKSRVYSYYLGDLKKIFKNYQKNGMLRRMTTEEIFEKNNKLSELKEKCKKLGLKITGNKSDLVARILLAEPDVVKSYGKKVELWICTTLGETVVSAYHEEKVQQEKDLQAHVFALLQKKRYKDAGNAVEQVRNNRVFPDWLTNTDDFTSRISLDYEVKKLEIVWKDTPKVLQKLKCDFLDKARYWISWDILRGTNSIRKFEKEPTNVEGLSIGNVMQALMIYASGKMQLEGWQKSRVFKSVRIAGLSKDTELCPECQKLTRKVYDPKKTPVIPNEKCQKTAPCPLCYFADMEAPKNGLFSLFK